MSDAVLLTGATGFIGQALLWRWLRNSDAKCDLLVRGRRDILPAQRIEDGLRESGEVDPTPWMKRVEVFDADVSRERFGLSASDYESIACRTTHIVHCAAAARFDLDLDEARRTNVGGVRNIIAFATLCPNLARVDYIGTAYVAGTRTGIIKEDDLDPSPQHRNTYEQSKFEAEGLLREWIPSLPISILRPSIVICDSHTGYASDHNGFYRALRMYLTGGLSTLPGYASSLLDLVPVDYVADAAFSLSRRAAKPGACYHLTAGPTNVATLGEIRDLASRYAGKPPFSLISPDEFAAMAAQVAARLPEDQGRAIREMALYMPYLMCENTFDNHNAVRDTGMSAPAVSTYFGRFVERILRGG
jgi:thioester reductase-like protein